MQSLRFDLVVEQEQANATCEAVQITKAFPAGARGQAGRRHAEDVGAAWQQLAQSQLHASKAVSSITQQTGLIVQVVPWLNLSFKSVFISVFNVEMCSFRRLELAEQSSRIFGDFPPPGSRASTLLLAFLEIFLRVDRGLLLRTCGEQCRTSAKLKRLNSHHKPLSCESESHGGGSCQREYMTWRRQELPDRSVHEPLSRLLEGSSHLRLGSYMKVLMVPYGTTIILQLAYKFGL